MTFDRELWQRARPLFDELVELKDSDRASRLEEIGASDPELRQTLDRLLLADVGEALDATFDVDSPSTATSSRDPLGIIGKFVSHFAVKDYLAAGGMGVVYTAEDQHLGRVVALKFPLPHQQMDRLVKERFVNEARSAAALDHTNLCTVHEIGESEHGVFLAMPLYPGETLKDRVAREGALPPDEALRIAQQITTGLASAHAAGIVHRDLKPANVMLLPDGTVKVLDFGLAKIRDISLTMSHTTIGTIGYVSPEQVRGGKVDARADLWSIGVMLYEMLTGHMPFRGEHELSILHNILHTDPARPSKANKDLSLRYDELIGALLQKDPDERYPSAEALLADINALRSGSPLSHRSPFWSRTPARRRVRTSIISIGAVAAAVLIIGALSWVAYRDREAASNIRSAGPIVKFVNNSATISTSAELLTVLSPSNAGKRVHLRSGTYNIDRTLIVPDGMTLEGEGAMLVTKEGRASGFQDGPRSILKMAANVGGDILTLGNKVTLKNLEIVDLPGRSGNIVAVASRRPADSISATIIESTLVNPNPFTIGGGGALGRAVHVTSRNPNMGDDPPAHEGSLIIVTVSRSVIRSPQGGGGFFAYNFAANSKVQLNVSHSYIGGTNEAVGGISRPDAVHDSEVRITSEGNLYRDEWADPCASALLGWNLGGGAGAPIAMQLPSTVRNRLVLHSLNDRIEGFTTGILATGGRAFYPAPRNQPPRNNYIELSLTGTTIFTPQCASVQATGNVPGVASAPETVADLRLVGSEVIRTGVAAGDSNVVRVELRGVTGSGKRQNVFSNADGTFGTIPVSMQGKGNRLEIVGDQATFMRDNRGIDPPPPAFFTGKQ